MKESQDMHGSDRPDMSDVYDGFADAFAKADKLPTWRYVGKPAMERLFDGKLHAGVTFLDLGSASGRVEAGILLPGGVPPEAITGVEISPKEVEIARNRIPGANFRVGDVSDPKLMDDRNGTFDFAFSHMVFEHLDDQQLRRTCENAYRLLKPGGTFGFVVTHPDKMTDVDGNLITHYGAFTTSAPWGGTLHNWRRSVKDTRMYLEQAGFKVEQVEDLEFPEQVPPGLSAEDQASFKSAAEKYRQYPSIRLLVRATKPA